MTTPPLDVEGPHLSVDDLIGYLGRSLAPEARASAEAHLAGCAQCRAAAVATVRELEHLAGDTDASGLRWPVDPTGLN